MTTQSQRNVQELKKLPFPVFGVYLEKLIHSNKRPGKVNLYSLVVQTEAHDCCGLGITQYIGADNVGKIRSILRNPETEPYSDKSDMTIKEGLVPVGHDYHFSLLTVYSATLDKKGNFRISIKKQIQNPNSETNI